MDALRRLGLALPLAVALAAGGLAVPSAAVADVAPTVTVSPSTGLEGGDTVTVSASGLSPTTTIQIVQCDVSAFDCYGGTTATSDAAGQLAASVQLADPVFRIVEFGDSPPVYCRADVCQIFIAWTDASGNLQQLSSGPLEFTGSPATIDANRTTNLRNGQWVRVRGTAYGAEGRTVEVAEESCFSIVQETNCFPSVVLGSGTVRADGTYALRVRVQRFLPFEVDCADANRFLGPCQLTAHVLDAAGQVDQSFGVSWWGDPGVTLTFRS